MNKPDWMGTPSNLRMFAMFQTGDSDVMEFVIDRSHRNDEPDLTFSEEAMEGLRDQMIIFVGGRLMRHWNDTADAPRKVRVTVQVEVL